MIPWKVAIWLLPPEYTASHLGHIRSHRHNRYNINAHVSVTLPSTPWSLFWREMLSYFWSVWIVYIGSSCCLRDRRVPINRLPIVEVLKLMSLMYHINNFGCHEFCFMWETKPGLHLLLFTTLAHHRKSVGLVCSSASALGREDTKFAEWNKSRQNYSYDVIY
jgi:hypothetical protein